MTLDKFNMPLLLGGQGFKDPHYRGVTETPGIVREKFLAFLFPLQGVFEYFLYIHDGTPLFVLNRHVTPAASHPRSMKILYSATSPNAQR
jgi:hypothetical protein